MALSETERCNKNLDVKRMPEQQRVDWIVSNRIQQKIERANDFEQNQNATTNFEIGGNAYEQN